MTIKTKIKNVIALFIVSLVLTSCIATSFNTVYNQPNTSGGYTDEKWLFVTSDVPADLQGDFDQQIVQFLERCYGDNFVNYKTNKNQYLLPGFTYDINNDQFINQLNRANQISFYLHVNAEVLKSDVGTGLDFNVPPPRGHYSFDQTKIRVTFEVVDIIKKEIVYSQSVIGTTTKDETNREDVLLTLPLDNQFKKAFKKAFKRFKKDFSCK